jgi:hypothetical protein
MSHGGNPEDRCHEINSGWLQNATEWTSGKEKSQAIRPGTLTNLDYPLALKRVTIRRSGSAGTEVRLRSTSWNRCTHRWKTEVFLAETRIHSLRR